MFRTALEAATACSAHGVRLDVVTPGWVDPETATETLRRIADAFPGRPICLYSLAARTQFGFVPDNLLHRGEP